MRSLSSFVGVNQVLNVGRRLLTITVVVPLPLKESDEQEERMSLATEVFVVESKVDTPQLGTLCHVSGYLIPTVEDGRGSFKLKGITFKEG